MNEQSGWIKITCNPPLMYQVFISSCNSNRSGEDLSSMGHIADKPKKSLRIFCLPSVAPCLSFTTHSNDDDDRHHNLHNHHNRHYHHYTIIYAWHHVATVYRRTTTGSLLTIEPHFSRLFAAAWKFCYDDLRKFLIEWMKTLVLE